jgi:hypothetical protein
MHDDPIRSGALPKGQEVGAAYLTWQEDAVLAAPAQDQAAAVYRAAGSGCREAEGQLASAVPPKAPRQVAREVQAVRSDRAAPALAEDQEAVSVGLVRGLPWWRNVG